MSSFLSLSSSKLETLGHVGLHVLLHLSLVTHYSLYNCSSTNFTTSDGFRLTWSYSHLGPAMPVGSINLNRLQQHINKKQYEMYLLPFCMVRVADLRRVGGMRYNFDTELPTLLDIEAVDGPVPVPVPSPAPRWWLIHYNDCDGDVDEPVPLPVVPSPATRWKTWQQAL